MIFSDVKDITIPEGSVKKIMSGAVTLWEKVSGYLKTVTGAFVAVTDALAQSAEDLTVTMSPVQYGSGTVSPSNIRPIVGWNGFKVYHSGINLIDSANSSTWTLNAYINDEGVISSSTSYKYTTDMIRVQPSTTYYVQEYKTQNAASGITVPYYRADGTFIQREIPYVAATGTGIKGGSFTTTADTHYIRISCEKNAYNIMLEYGSTRSDYVAYDGHNFDVTMPAVGKNLFDKDSVTISSISCYNSLGEELTRSGFEYHLPSGTYTLRCNSETVGAYIYMDVVDTNRDFVSYGALSTTASAGWKTVTVTLTEGQYLLIFKGSTSALTLDVDLQIESGSTATDYEAFKNNVYGGTLDITTGELTVTWSGVVMDGTVNKASNCRQISDTSEYTYLRGYYVVDFVDLLNSIPYNTGESISSHFEWYTYTARRAARPDTIYFASSARVVYWCSSTYTTLEEFNGYLQNEYANGRPVTLVYPRGSSTLSYQLTPKQVDMILGYNAISSDCDSVSLTYMGSNPS